MFYVLYGIMVAIPYAIIGLFIWALILFIKNHYKK